MPLLRYRIVDVFTTEALEGNALAVFTDASQIDEAIMQKIAREMNLAETTFVLPPESPDCAARVRIFTPKKEMSFALNFSNDFLENYSAQTSGSSS